MSQSLSPQDFRRYRDSGAPPRTGTLSGQQPYHLVGAMIGSAAGWYAGSAILLPFLLIAATWFAAYRLFGPERRALVPAFSVTTGQMLTLVAGFVFLGFVGPVRFNLLDVVWLFIGAVWLVKKPSKYALYWLAFYEVGSGVMNAFQLTRLEWSSPMAKALVGALFVRVLALEFLYVAHVHLGKTQKKETSAAATAETDADPKGSPID